jgi:hypothetical protein
MVGCWERFNELSDPTIDIKDVSFFGPLRIYIAAVAVMVVILIAYRTVKAITGGSLVEYTIEALNQDTSSSLQFKTQGSRFKVFFVLTFLVVFTLAANYLTFILFDYANNAAQYLSLFPIVNYYAFLLAIYFLPSNQVEVGTSLIVPDTFKTEMSDRRLKAMSQQFDRKDKKKSKKDKKRKQRSEVIQAPVDESLSVEDKPSETTATTSVTESENNQQQQPQQQEQLLIDA